MPDLAAPALDTIDAAHPITYPNAPALPNAVDADDQLADTALTLDGWQAADVPELARRDRARVAALMAGALLLALLMAQVATAIALRPASSFVDVIGQTLLEDAGAPGLAGE